MVYQHRQVRSSIPLSTLHAHVLGIPCPSACAQQRRPFHVKPILARVLPHNTRQVFGALPQRLQHTVSNLGEVGAYGDGGEAGAVTRVKLAWGYTVKAFMHTIGQNGRSHI